MSANLSHKDIFSKVKYPYRIPSLGYDILLTSKTVGELKFPSLRMVCCDPLSGIDTDPFETEFPDKLIPLELIFAELRDQTTLAFVILRLSDQPAVRWQPARLIDGSDSTWRDPEGFYVENSVICIVDEEAALDLLGFDDDDPDEFEREIYNHLSARKSTVGVTNCALLNHHELSSERGDDADEATFIAKLVSPPVLETDTAILEVDNGFYPCHWGFDKFGTRAMFVIDFKKLDLKFTPFGIR